MGVLRGQLLIGVAFAAHYALIGIPSAVIVNVLGSLQTATALLRCRLGPRGTRAAGLIAAMAATTIATWAGPASVLVAVGQAFIAIARMQKDVALMFMLLLVGQLLWALTTW